MAERRLRWPLRPPEDMPEADERGPASPMPDGYGPLARHAPPGVASPASELAPAGSGGLSTPPAGAVVARGVGSDHARPPTGTARQAAPPAASPVGTPTRVAPPAGAGTASRSRRRRRAQWMQSRGAVRHVHVGTVAKVSLVFYFLVLAAVVVATIILWYVASAFGAIHSIERSVQTLFDLKSFKLHEARVIGYISGGGAILAVAGAIANVIAACMYNLISDVVGGVKVDIVVVDADPRAGPGPS